MMTIFGAQLQGEHFVITGEDANHLIYALRTAVGEELCVVDDTQTSFVCKVVQIDKQSVKAKVCSVSEKQTEPSLYLTLYQALPKGDKMDEIIQKSVELGVSEIVPFVSSRCISRPAEKAMQNKWVRYQKIAKAAAEQSGRGIIPQVQPLCSFEQMLGGLPPTHCHVMCYEKGGAQITAAFPASTKAGSVIVGPEGGFSMQEVQQARRAGVVMVGLGNRILRCQTAPIVAATLLMYITGNLCGGHACEPRQN